MGSSRKTQMGCEIQEIEPRVAEFRRRAVEAVRALINSDSNFDNADKRACVMQIADVLESLPLVKEEA